MTKTKIIKSSSSSYACNHSQYDGSYDPSNCIEETPMNPNLDYASTDPGATNNNSVTYDSSGNVVSPSNATYYASTATTNVNNTLQCFKQPLQNGEDRATHNYYCIQNNIINSSNLGQQFACDATGKISNVLVCNSSSIQDQTDQVNNILSLYTNSDNTVDNTGDDVTMDICKPTSIMNINNNCFQD